MGNKVAEVCDQLYKHKYESLLADVKGLGNQCVCVICAYYDAEPESCDCECDLCTVECACGKCTNNDKFVWRGEITQENEE